MNNQKETKAIDLVYAGLKRRHAAERRFRRYGIAAILMGFLFLIIFFASIIANGYSAFVQTYVQIEVEYDESKIDPQGNREPDALSAGDYSGIVKATMRKQFPWVKKRRDKRKLYGLVSTGAAYQLREHILESPELIGTKQKIWVPMDDDADMFFKGYATDLREYRGTTDLTLKIDDKYAELSAGGEVFRAISEGVVRHLEAERAKLEKEQTEIQRGLEQNDEEKAKYESDISRIQSSIEEISSQLKSPHQLLDLPAEFSSYLVAVNDGYINIRSVSPGQIKGEIIAPMSSGRHPKSGEWKIIQLVTPESGRRLTDTHISWLLHLQQSGLVEKRFNAILFTAGDSREPELSGIWGAAKGSFYALLVTLLLSFPIGVAAAVYLEEFAPENRWTDLIEVNINNLAAVPSIVFGLLGLAMFINFFGLPRSAPLVGGLVLTLMTLPTIIIASRAALKSVPPSIREAALGVGASSVQMVFYHVLPLAVPGMLTGTIIGMARALGESAPLLMIGMVAFIVDVPEGLFDPATVLPVQIYLWADSPERAFVERTSAATMVLLMFLIAMNTVAVILRKRFERRW